MSKTVSLVRKDEVVRRHSVGLQDEVNTFLSHCNKKIAESSYLPVKVPILEPRNQSVVNEVLRLAKMVGWDCHIVCEGDMGRDGSFLVFK